MAKTLNLNDVFKWLYEMEASWKRITELVNDDYAIWGISEDSYWFDELYDLLEELEGEITSLLRTLKPYIWGGQ